MLSQGRVNPFDWRAVGLRLRPSATAVELNREQGITLDAENRVASRLDRDGEGGLRLFHKFFVNHFGLA